MNRLARALPFVFCIGCSSNASDGAAPTASGSGGEATSSGGSPASGGAASGSSGETGGGPGETGGTPGETGGTPGTTPSFACSEEQLPDSLPLRRLSHAQYRNTVEDLVRFAVPGSAEDVLAEIRASLDGLLHDVRQGPDTTFALFDRLDQTVQQRHVDERYALAVELAAALTRSAERVAELVGDCAGGPSDVECLAGFLQRFGERVQRRPLTPDDLEFYRRPAGEPPFDAADYADVTALLLSSPYFGYTVEHGAAGAEGERLALSAYELASRLSYQFWQTMPDEALLDAARSGELETDAGYAAAVERVLSDPRALRGLEEFWRQWLENPKLEELDRRVGEPVYDAFLDGFAVTAELKTHMQREVIDAALYHVQNGLSFADLFASNRSFARTDDLASIYGTPLWDGGEPPVFPEPERAGLLTRAALVATGLSDTRPIIKGVMIRKAILCDDVPPPPAEVANAPPPVATEDASTRQAVEARTAGVACAGCHQQLINDLGFATENFDALGRLRSEQRLFDEDGRVVGAAPVDTVTVPQVTPGDLSVSTGAADLTRIILESDKPYACFARQYFRFTFARLEHDGKDGCLLSTLRDELAAGSSLLDVLQSAALDPAFRERSF